MTGKLLFFSFILIFTASLVKPSSSEDLTTQKSDLHHSRKKNLPNGCSCKGYDCSCCVFMDVPRIHLNETGCVDVSYLPKEIGVDMKLTLNDRTLIEEKVSLRNPPPLCVGIPHFHDYASLCVVLFNVTYTQRVGACIKVAAKLAGVTLEEINIGCFYYDTVALLEEEKEKKKSVQNKLLTSFYKLFKLFVTKKFDAKQTHPLTYEKIIFEKTN